MKLVALDLSLTSTGWAAFNDRDVSQSPDGTHTHGLIKPVTSSLRGLPRLRWIRNHVRAVVDGASVVVLEGYAFAAHASHAHELGELGGVVRMALFEAGFPIVDIPPASVKKFASGKGNAKKEQVLADAVRKLNYTGSSFDEADALWLLAMAEAYYCAAFGLTADQKAALAKVAWPNLTSENAHA